MLSRLTRALTMNSAAASPAAHFFSMDAAAGQVTPLPSPPAGLEVERVRCLSDNYGWLVHDPSSGQTASIDSPEAAPLISKLDERGWTLTHVFITHHHHDHCGGNPELKARFPSVQILGPGSEEKTIVKTCGLGLDAPLAPGDSFSWGGGNVDVIDVGGHTLGHIAYHWTPESEGGGPGCAFVGDSLFVLGCGRLFEGTAQQAWLGLQRLMALADDTVVYCAHEYSEANAAFAETIEPPSSNAALAARIADIRARRRAQEATVPTTIGAEKATNPFLRPAAARAALSNLAEGATDAEAFAEVRRRKDMF